MYLCFRCYDCKKKIIINKIKFPKPRRDLVKHSLLLFEDGRAYTKGVDIVDNSVYQIKHGRYMILGLVNELDGEYAASKIGIQTMRRNAKLCTIFPSNLKNLENFA